MCGDPLFVDGSVFMSWVIHTLNYIFLDLNDRLCKLTPSFPPPPGGGGGLTARTPLEHKKSTCDKSS